MKKVCTLCGCSRYDAFAFKSGHVCEHCLQELKCGPHGCRQVLSGH